MNPGMLFVERRLNLPNLKHFLISNRCYGSTEEVDIPFAQHADYAGIARGVGIERVYRFDDLDAFKGKFDEAVMRRSHLHRAGIRTAGDRGADRSIRWTGAEIPLWPFHRKAHREKDLHGTLAGLVRRNCRHKLLGDSAAMSMTKRALLLSLLSGTASTVLSKALRLNPARSSIAARSIKVIVPTGPGGTYALYGNIANEATVAAHPRQSQPDHAVHAERHSGDELSLQRPRQEMALTIGI